MKILVKVRKGRWLKPMVVGFSAVVVWLLIAGKAAADLIEFVGVISLIVLAITTQRPTQGQSWVIVGTQLLNAVEDAQSADSQGNTIDEVAALSKAIGAADAMTGMISSCDTCGDVRADLQRIIHLAGILKLKAEGIPLTCTPDGVLEPTEECDPLIEPDGCSAGTFVGLCDPTTCMCVATP
jgi:hypothetical protein